MFAVKALLMGLFVAWSSPQAGYEESPADSFRETRWFVPMDGPLGSPFGPRWGRIHEGIDIEGWAETRVRAAQTGVVTHVGWLPHDSGHGLVVKVRHEGRIVTMYAHLARAFVKKGETVMARQIIGRAGCTGFCTGTHLHFQVWRRGHVIDPLILLGRHAFDDL